MYIGLCSTAARENYQIKPRTVQSTIQQRYTTLPRWGTNSSIFLNIGDTFGPQAFLGVVLYIKI